MEREEIGTHYFHNEEEITAEWLLPRSCNPEILGFISLCRV